MIERRKRRDREGGSLLGLVIIMAFSFFFLRLRLLDRVTLP